MTKTEKNGLDGYIARMSEIPGGIHHPDPYVFQAISDSQIESGMAGDILETGSYQGRSAIVLGYLVRGSNTLHICEPFPKPSVDNPDFQPHTIDWYETYNQEIFEKHYLRFHDELPEIHACTSLDLPGRLAPGSFRFVHLDGSHTREVLESDISLAKDLLKNGGVMSFNLYRSMHTLEVAAAVWSEVASSSIFPMCATETHLYASVTPYGSKETTDLIARLRSVPRIKVITSEFRGVATALVHALPREPKITVKSFVPPILLSPARKARSKLYRTKGL